VATPLTIPVRGLWFSQDRSPSFVPDEIIVKYRDSVTEPVERLLDRGRSFRSATSDASDRLDNLHAKFGARSARRAPSLRRRRSRR